MSIRKFSYLIVFCVFMSGYEGIIAQTFTKLIHPQLASMSGEWNSVRAFDVDNNYTLDILYGRGAGSTTNLYLENDDSIFIYRPNHLLSTHTSAGGFPLMADVDNDLDADIFYPSHQYVNAPYFINDSVGNLNLTGSGNFVTDMSNLDCRAAAWIDVNNDGKVDLFVTDYNQSTNYLYQNNGNGNFSRISTGALATTTGKFWVAAWGDIENDGDADLFLGNFSGNNKLLINQGNGNFMVDNSSIISQEGINVFGAAWGDYDNDGYADLFVSRTANSKNFLYHNNGNGTFSKITTGALVNDQLKSGGCSWDDLDNDGDLDLYVSHTGMQAGNNNLIFKNNGNGTFNKISSGAVYAETEGTESCITADINQDGHIDILNANRFYSYNSIFLNNGNANNFVKFRLYGTNSNGYAIGSRIVIKNNGQTQMRYQAPMHGNRGQKSFEIHFGLGQDSIIDTLQVFWPSGNTCVLYNVAAGEFYNISEGNCLAVPYTQAEFSDSTSFLSAYFSDHSKGALKHFRWDFGDGDTSHAQNPRHVYTSPGKYQVCLTVFDEYGKHRNICKSIDICPDTSKIGFVNTVQNLQAVYTDTSNAAAHQWYWDFGDGTQDSGKVVNHLYTTTGTYIVCLTVVDSCRSKQICRTVQICNTNLAAAFNDSISGLTAYFNNNSTSADSIYWDFGDGTYSSQSNPVHIYGNSGTYYVCITAYDFCSSTSYCDSVQVCANLTQAAFSYNRVSATMTFNDNSLYAKTWHWEFGDGNTSSAQSPTYTYSSFGTYKICLTTTNDCNADSTCQKVIVCPYNVQPSFTASKGVVPLAVQFNNTSVDAVSYLWKFGDGSTSTSKNPLKIYPNSDTYYVCLTATDSCGGSKTLCDSLNVGSITLEESIWSALSIYPNPADQKLHIAADNFPADKISLEIYDLRGALLQRETIMLKAGGKGNVDLENLAAGTYALRLRLGEEFITVKLVKK